MFTRRPLVYVAGPYTSPDPVENTHTTVKVADELLAGGVAPIVPHLTLLWHAITPKPYDAWLELDRQHLARCDALLRIPGPSSGADAEVALAWELGIPVFDDVTSLLAWAAA